MEKIQRCRKRVNASYLELGLRYDLPLATSDNLLKRVSQAIGIMVISQ